MAEQFDDFDEDEVLDRGDDFESEDEEENEEDEETDEESDEEEDEEEVSGEDSEEDGEDEEPRREQRVPISRLNEVIAQRESERERTKWLEEQLARLIEKDTRAQAAAKEAEPSFDFDQAEESYATFLIEGDIAKAAALRKTIDKERQKETTRLIKEVRDSVEKDVKTKSSQVSEEIEFKTLVANFENKYKFLNAKNSAFNEEAVDTVNTLMAGFVAAGKSKGEALTLAVKKAAPLYAKEVPSVSKQRKVEAGKKAAKAANAQPGKTTSSGKTTIDATKLSASKLSDRDLDKLTLKELKMLRGD